jgi:competence ComEA-like helix-hairpin-helix protein
MWKDFFYLTKREKAALYTMTVLVIVAQGLIWTHKKWLPLVQPMINRYTASARDSVDASSILSTGVQFISNPEKTAHVPKIEKCEVAALTRLKSFDPNEADSQQLSELGLSRYVVGNIIKYRQNNGVFYKPEDLKKIYGLDQANFNRLKPYVQIANRFGHEKTIGRVENQAVVARIPQDSLAIIPEKPFIEHVSNKTEKSLNKPVEMINTSSLFDLNTVDTSSLKLLKGVGQVTAERIIRYREKLGGFYSVEQLAEIKGIYPATLRVLESCLTVNPGSIQKLKINELSLEKLMAHPYLSFYQAKVIVELRKARKKINGLDELFDYDVFKDATNQRLRWYLEL